MRSLPPYFFHPPSFSLFVELIYSGDGEFQDDPRQKRPQGNQDLGYLCLTKEDLHLHQLDIENTWMGITIPRTMRVIHLAIDLFSLCLRGIPSYIYHKKTL